MRGGSTPTEAVGVRVRVRVVAAQLEREILVHLRAQRAAQVELVGVLHVVVLVLEVVVEVAVAVLALHHEAAHQALVALAQERHVQRRADLLAVVIRVGPVDQRLPLRLRLVPDHVHRAGGGVAAVDDAGRAARDLDRAQVPV